MPTRTQKVTTSRKGVNYIRDVVETNNSIFTEIPQQDDLGIDAIVELLEGTQPANQSVAFQIKSGDSFFDTKTNECRIPVGNHYHYWKEHSLPVYGVVYVPLHQRGYWVNIKEHFEAHGTVSVIKYRVNRVNVFDNDHFQQIFLPLAIGKKPILPFDEALSLFQSDDFDESLIGLVVLFYDYSDKNLTWDKFIEFFRQRQPEQIPKNLIKYMSFVASNPDVWRGREKLTQDSTGYALNLLAQFGEAEIFKLLTFAIEDGIHRGSLGQAVETIISSIPQSYVHLERIIQSTECSLEIMEAASIIFAYKHPETSLPVLHRIAHKSNIVSFIVAELERTGWINLYL